MKHIIYVRGFTNNPEKQSKKALQIAENYPECKVHEFNWKATDTNIVEDLEKFFYKVYNTEDDFTIIASSTGCNLTIQALDFFKKNSLSRPQIVFLNPLFDLEHIKTELEGFGENLRNQVKTVDYTKLEDCIILFAGDDEVIDHDLIPDQGYEYLLYKNDIHWLSANHSFTNINFSVLMPYINKAINNTFG